MIEHTTAPTAAMYRVECHAGRTKLYSNVLPTAYSAWCQQCKVVHWTTWDSLPSDVLRGMVEAINGVLVARGEC
jgi:hypothetical protein